MKQKRLKLSIVFLTCIMLTGIHAQEIHNAIPASGGDFSGTGGSVSYTLGSVFYEISTGTNGSVIPGAQQPYEISVYLGNEIKTINLSVSVYPNPATDRLHLSIDNYQSRDLEYSIIDMTGKLLDCNKIVSAETQIMMSKYSSAIYFLKVVERDREIKTFKIVKN